MTKEANRLLLQSATTGPPLSVGAQTTIKLIEWRAVQAADALTEATDAIRAFKVQLGEYLAKRPWGIDAHSSEAARDVHARCCVRATDIVARLLNEQDHLQERINDAKMLAVKAVVVADQAAEAKLIRRASEPSSAESHDADDGESI